MLKLALIENLRRLADEMLDGARRARAPPTRYVARIDATGAERRRRCRRRSDRAFVVQLLQRVREYGLRLSPVRAAVDEHLAPRQTTAEDAIRAEHQRQGGGAGVGGERHHQPAPVLDARLAASTSRP